MTTAQKLSFDVQLSDHARTAAEREQVLASPGFGQVFTDHMISIDYTEGEGWHDARLMPYGPLSLDPATSVFHYAPGALRGPEGLPPGGRHDRDLPPVRQRRPVQHARRGGWPCPSCPRRPFVESLELLVQTDREWVPDRRRGTASTCAPS